MTPAQKYSNVARKWAYYTRWYNEMPMKDRRGWLGKWVRDRVKLYNDAAISFGKEAIKKGIESAEKGELINLTPFKEFAESCKRASLN